MDDRTVGCVARPRADAYRVGLTLEGPMVDRLFWIANLAVMIAIVVFGGVAIAYVAG